jgi:hypothetical protein
MAAATTKTIRLPVHGNVKLPDLHAAIARPMNLTGCFATRPWKANPTSPPASPLQTSAKNPEIAGNSHGQCECDGASLRHDHGPRQPRAGYHV